MVEDLLKDDESKRLRSEVNALKKQLGVPSYSDSDSRDLANSISSLTRIFEQASEDLKIDTHDAVMVAEKLEKILTRLEKIEIQNEKIAKGIVALADMVEDLSSRPTNTNMPQQRRQTYQSSAPPQPMQQGNTNTVKPLPTYDIPLQQDKKKPFLSFK